MKSSQLLYSAVIVGLTAMAGNASAALTGTQTALLDFEIMALGASQGGGAAYYGKANTLGGCPATNASGKCYAEEGFVVGSAFDPDFAGSAGHLHRGDLNPLDIDLHHHADAAGIYVRAADSSAFSLDSFHADILASINPVDTGYWEILGFSTALNGDLHTWDWANNQQPLDIDGLPRVYTGSGPYPTQVAYQRINNTGAGFLDTVLLNNSFKDIKAFWIHYGGYPNAPIDTATFDFHLDNVALSAPKAVPVPAAVYLFGTGLMGLLAVGKRRRFI
ncbi:MAG: hypothetical protein HOO92_09370 [Methylococcaceae bacterium]|nr:hypothetical protein [Methylococcaceae bacterium]